MDIASIGVATYHTRVEAWQCDHNQHWNVRNYMRSFQQASYVAADIGGYSRDPQMPFTHHLRYHRELFLTAQVEVRSAVLADGEFEGAVVHLLLSKGQISATAMEHPVVSGGTLPRIAAHEVRTALPRSIEGTPHGTDRPAIPAGARLVQHGVVQPHEVDHTGALTLDNLMGRIASGSNGLLGDLGFTPEFVKSSGISRMGVETKLTQLKAIPAGTRILSVVDFAGRGEKNFVLRHEFFAADGDRLAAADQGIVTVDMKLRRATALPDFLREAVGSA